jgi:putative FmdB family regulatory protein
MITYVYYCHKCKREFEVKLSIKSPAKIICPMCKVSEARRQIVSGNFILKGKGWFKDGY